MYEVDVYTLTTLILVLHDIDTSEALENPNFSAVGSLVFMFAVCSFLKTPFFRRVWWAHNMQYFADSLPTPRNI